MRSVAGFEGSPRAVRLALWRAVEAQHVISTMVLVDTQAEQELLESLLEQAKPPIPAPAGRLHYLLFTPFRYPPTGYGSRFRRPGDAGVFYGADEVRTACAEVGYWRWRFLLDAGLERIDPRPQTVFQVAIRGPAIDLRQAPWVARRKRWTDPVNYDACQTLAAEARSRGVAVIRYESVRDPAHGGAAAVLAPAAFARRAPTAVETWYLAVDRHRVRWYREGVRHAAAGYEFEAALWAATGGPASSSPLPPS